MVLIKKNESTTTLRRVPVIIVDQSDGNSLETGQTNFNIEVSKAGAAQASGTGVWGEIGDGEYYYQFGSTEVNTFGFLIARFQKTGMREFKAVAQIVGFDPYQTISTQSSVNALNDPSQTEINISVWSKTVRTITATPQTSINEHNQSQTLINQLNDLSTSQVQSIVNAEGLEIQSLINALNDLSQTQVNAQVDTALSDIRLDEFIVQSTANIDAVINSFLDLIMNKGVSQLFSQATDSLEALRDNQSAGGGATPTSIWNFGTRVLTANTNLNDPTPSVINAVITTAHGAGSYVGAGGQTVVNLLQQNQSLINNLDSDIIALNDPTSSAINAVITTAHGAGSYVGAGAAQTIVNKLDAIQSDINASQGTGFVKDTHSLKNIQSDINALNDISVSEVQSIVNAAGGTSPTSIWNFSTRILTGMTQTDINEHNTTQSLINALDDVSVAQVQSIINTLNDVSVSQIQSVVNAEGLEVQSLINALNDVSTSEVQSIVNAQGLEVQSLINAMQSDVTIIKGLSGLYLVAEYTHNSSNINTKIEFWHYSSQTNKNTHDKSTGLLNTFQLDVTLTGQLASVVKMGD